MATWVKCGMMSKRAQGKSALGLTNWKTRFIILTETSLTYFEKPVDQYTSTQTPPKGLVALNEVRVIENTPQQVFDKPNVFQLGYGSFALFLQAASIKDRDEWVGALRKICWRNFQMQSNFHPGFFDGKWTCCGMDKVVPGCEEAFDYKSLDAPKATTPLPQAASTSAGSSQTLTAANSRTLGRSASGQALQQQPPQPQQQHTPHQPPAQQQRQSQSSHADVPRMKPFEAEVLFDYRAEQSEDLSVSVNERVTIVECPQVHWWKARNARGLTGLVPSNYLKRISLDSQEWFHGRISRSEASSMLRMANLEGCFLVRESESKPGEYSLSVSHGDDLRHYHVKFEEGEYYVNDRHRFPDIIKLVEYHKLNSGGLITRLRKAVREVNIPLAPGLGLDHWELSQSDIKLTRELGRGQFGVVSEGVYKGQVKVAVKQMKSMSEDEFVAEAKVMQQFSHPNLVKLYGVCTKSPFYIVTELMVNGCLLDYLREQSAMLSAKPALLMSMNLQVASAMVYLESKGVIHRDLAARNCLVGENNVVKVADFGLARFVLDDEYTASEGSKFPIKWAAPEVIGYARFSTKSDVWSFGILIWEIWALGKTPYPAMSNLEVIDQVFQGYRMDSPASCPSFIYSLMLETWAQEPDKRPTFAVVEWKLEQGRNQDA